MSEKSKRYRKNRQKYQRRSGKPKIGRFCRIRRERSYDRGDPQRGYIWANWHHFVDRCLCDPRLVPYLGQLGLLFCIQDHDSTVASPTGEPVTQIFLDTVGEKGAIVFMVSDVFDKNDTDNNDVTRRLLVR